MKEIINFIPRTVAECRQLLEDIKGKDAAQVADRYNRMCDLDKGEIEILVKLIESQIGAQAPMVEPEPVQQEENEVPAEEQAPEAEETPAEEEVEEEAPVEEEPKKASKK